MNRLSLMLLAGAMAAGGCQAERFRSQPLGQVDAAEAFRAGRNVLGQYFSVASADPQTGRIVSRPKPVPTRPERILGGASSARQVATLRIRQGDGGVVADLRVDIQRQDVPAMRQMQPVTVDNERPSQTSSEEAAIASDQDQAWETVGRDTALEGTILADLLRQLEAKKK